METRMRNYILATLLIIAVSLAILVLTSKDFMDVLLPIIGILVVYPCVVMGVYIYLEGTGYRWINGIDWSSMTEQERTNTCSYVGFYLAVGCVILGIAISCMLINFIIAIILLVVAVILIMAACVSTERAASKKFVERSVNSKIAVFLVFSVLTIAPIMVLGSTEFTQEAVNVEFDENNVHIQAPMFNYHFEYGLIEDLEFDPDFDKGKRIAGYGTPTICSGTFSNDVFGNYKLASYTQVKPCIFFLYEGKYYAFNQGSNELTQQAYEQLLSHVKE